MSRRTKARKTQRKKDNTAKPVCNVELFTVDRRQLLLRVNNEVVKVRGGRVEPNLKTQMLHYTLEFEIPYSLVEKK